AASVTVTVKLFVPTDDVSMAVPTAGLVLLTPERASVAVTLLSVTAWCRTKFPPSGLTETMFGGVASRLTVTDRATLSAQRGAEQVKVTPAVSAVTVAASQPEVEVTDDP